MKNYEGDRDTLDPQLTSSCPGITCDTLLSTPHTTCGIMRWAVRTSSSSPPTPLVWWAWIKPICLLEPSHYSFSTEITINQRLSEEVFSPSNFMSAGRSCQVSGVCSPWWEQNSCFYRKTSRDRITLNWEKKRCPTHACPVGNIYGDTIGEETEGK